MECANPKCKKKHEGKFGSGKYCSRKCANARIWTPKINEKRRQSVIKTWSILSLEIKKKKLNPLFTGLKKWKEKQNKYFHSLPFSKLSPIFKRKRIFEEQKGKCLICKISNWMNKKLTLQLDHIDGNNENDKRKNLRLLCPNCHSQTETFCKGLRYR